MATQPYNIYNELYFDEFLKNLLRDHQVDVQLKACDSHEEAGISAHKLILSARSEVFRNMFDSDECKASTKLETVTFSDLKHEELEAFVEFLYRDGSRLSEKAKVHVVSLYRAANKYEIPHLRYLCRIEIIATLKALNALKVLELSQIPFDKSLSDAAFTTIKKHRTTISNSTEFKQFVLNHPDLTVEIVKFISLRT